MDFSKLEVALGRPKEVLLEFNKVFNYYKNGVDYNPDGIDFIDEDWDILTIIDACRYDIFEEVSTLPGQLSKVESMAAGTVEFIKSNLDGKRLTNTVYVTANPQLYRFREQIDVEFHHIEHVWKDEWDETLGTVTPQTTTRVAKQIAKEYPDKRLIIHYNQPHAPFLGETAKGRVIGPRNKKARDRGIVDHWKTWLRTELTPDEIYRKAYTENLEIVLPYVNELMREIEGKHVVTSDHGEGLGARACPIPIKIYEHRVGIHIPELVEVPWLEFTNGSRRQITDGVQSADGAFVDADVVSDRLQDLGYL